jgi:alpha-2-macroglobulin-like protein
MRLLVNAATWKDNQAWWTAEETGVYSRGASASVETTGLAAQALLKWGQDPETVRKAMTYITSKRDASGAWGTTQATIMALRALVLSAEKGAADVRGTLEITLNGKPVTQLALTPENNDLFHRFVLKNVDAKGANTVGIRFDGKGNLAYQVAGRYFVPWNQQPAREPLSIDVAYDRTHLSQDDVATATATVRNNLQRTANMVMVDLGIPPGFDLLTEDLQRYQEKSAGQKDGKLQKFSVTPTQAILYFDSIAPAGVITLRFRLHAKYPIRARTFQSRVYEYYNPDLNSVAAPIQLDVRKR